MSDSEIDLNLINKISHDLIIKHLTQNECQKNIVLSKDLSKIIDTIIKFSKLKEHGVNKIFYLDKVISKDPTEKNIEWIYIIRPEIENMNFIIDQIKSDVQHGTLSRYPYKILFSPRKLYICEIIFEQAGIYDYISLNELENDLVQLDNDLLSMEMPKFFLHYFLHGDQSWFMSIAKALINIQDWFGQIPNVHIHGNCGKGVYELMNRLIELNSNYQLNKLESKIGHLILVDRSIDYVTPFCSPLTYEGLLDESFKINAGIIELPTTNQSTSTTDNQTSQQTKTKRVKLSNEDRIFEEIRTMHVSEVFGHLKNIVSNMKNVYEKRNELSSINQLKEFISSDLKDYNLYKELVNLHLNMSEIIINSKSHIELPVYLTTEHNILRGKEYRKSFEYIEELINRNYNIYQVLRLMILLSKTNDGLSTGDYNQLVNQFLNSYGFNKIFLINKLKRVGFFETIDSANGKDESKSSNLLKIHQQLSSRIKFSTNYGTISRKLDIIPGDLNPSSLKSTSKDVDSAYAFNGSYRPILCQYISQILFSDVKNVEEISKLFIGDYDFKSKNSYSVRNKYDTSANRTVLIFFLGGCTYTEIAVLKKLALKKGFKFLFATTSFLNANTLINLFEE